MSIERLLDQPTAERSMREEVVKAARSWIGTPYHHMADVKGHGVDCAMILVRVYCDLGIAAEFDPRPYTRDWFLHRDEERYLGFLLARSREVRVPNLGDVAVFRVGRLFAHAGIVSRLDPLCIIHAFAPAMCVVEDVVSANAEIGERVKTARFASFWD